MCFNVTQTELLRQHKMVSRWSGAPLWLQQNARLLLLVFSVEMSYLRHNVRVRCPCLTGSWAQPPSALVPTPQGARLVGGSERGQAWLSSCHLATGGGKF